MAIVNQRVCDLPSCAKPITEGMTPTFMLAATEEGEPDPDRLVEFDDPKCGRKWSRRHEEATDHAEYLDFPKASKETAGKK